MPHYKSSHHIIRYNELKHQRSAIVNFIKSYKDDGIDLKSQLQILGASQMDIYTGELTTSQLIAQIIDFLKSKRVFERAEYFEWLELNDEFRNVTLSDDSVWILRKGTDGRYVHIHPGRYTPHTIRVKATSLKTVIACQIHLKYQRPNLKQLNWVRVHLLNLSPIKRLNEDSGLFKLFDILVSVNSE